ncbi:hypothetical protein [Paenibacillus marinisediminis]
MASKIMPMYKLEQPLWADKKVKLKQLFTSADLCKRSQHIK